MAASSNFCAVNICRLLMSRLSLSVTCQESFHTSSAIMAEPMKKKKKADPAVVIAREQRKRRRIEKQIRRLKKFSRKVKPVDDIVGDRNVQKQLDVRMRRVPEISAEESERRVLLEKEWCRYQTQLSKREGELLRRAAKAQQKALDELRVLSPQLYDAAIQIDEDLLPFTSKMRVLSPPIKDYDPPDGDYIDTTKTYD